MIKTKHFDAFGVHYRTEQFSAEVGISMMARDGDIHPCELLSKTFAQDAFGSWKALSDRTSINSLIKDFAAVLPPRVVLSGVIGVVREFNFGFLSNWKSARIPSRFVDSSGAVSSAYSEPIIAQLIQDDIASLRELEEYYSLEDAFKQFDILVVKGINQAIANEASMKKSQHR